MTAASTGKKKKQLIFFFSPLPVMVQFAAPTLSAGPWAEHFVYRIVAKTRPTEAQN